MSDDADPTQTLSELRQGLSSVEETLKPLLERKWTETTGSLDTLERAKMDVLVSYAINDLVWVYLKMKGVDPATHDVSAELERIRTYYAKVKAVEEPESRRTTQIDKAAAGRIISHGIPARQRVAPAPGSTSAAALARQQAEAAVSEQSIGAGRTSSRFRFVAKDDETEKITAGGSDAESDDDDELEGGEREGDEADELLNELQEQFQAKQPESESTLADSDRKQKRKRAEDLGAKST